jgi:hypothetical protein
VYSKIIIFTLFICINAFADFYDQIEKIDKKREDLYFDMNKTLKKPDTSVYQEKIQNAMNGLQDRINSYETKVYGGATKKEIFSNIQTSLNQNSGQKTDINIEDFVSNNRIYIFMSSSVPLSIWHEYGSFLDKNKLRNGSLLLRGCINGCEKIMPTMEFLKKVIEYKPNEKMNPSILLDPLLFERYEINEVPCVVYAKDVSYLNKGFQGSEGSKEEVKTGKIYKSCGDWNMLYHLEELEKQSNDISLTKLIKKLREPK